MLLLFGVMLTHKIYDLDLRSEVTQFLPGPDRRRRPVRGPRRSIALHDRSWAGGAGARPRRRPPTRSARLFLGQYLLPFEAASILLLVALMGAAMIVRRKKDA